MTTEIVASRAARPLAKAAPTLEPRTSRPRLVVLACDPDMIAVLRDVFADDYEVITPAHPATIVAIDTEEPDVLLVGTLGGGLTPDELITLTTRHMRLSAVQIVLMSAEANVLANAGRLKQRSGVTVLSLPTDLETILCVVDTVARAAHAESPSRLPDICSHGFDVGEGRHSGCR